MRRNIYNVYVPLLLPLMLCIDSTTITTGNNQAQRLVNVLCLNLEEPVRVASPTRINLEELVRVASPTRINLEEPIRVRPAQPGQIRFSVCLSVRQSVCV